VRQDHDMPVFSVVIPCFNKASCIERAVTSAKCAAPKTEVIVVDDCSTDGSREVIEFLDIDQKILHQTNRGAVQAYLSGMRAARGRYLVMLDGDDVLAPSVFAALLAHLDKDSCARLGIGVLSLALPDQPAQGA
jgi:glycosyltransferase involved in cell wall biosynthesis